MSRFLLALALLLGATGAAGAQGLGRGDTGGLQAVPPPFSVPYRYGSPVASFGSTSNAMFLGVNAGAAFPIGTQDTIGSIGIGAGAGQSLAGVGAEDTFVGVWAGQYVVTGGLIAAFGMHACGHVDDTGLTCIGNDSMRDSFSSGGYIVAVGQSAVAHGNPSTTVGVGALAGRGSSSFVTLSGTVTVADTVTVSLAASGSTPAAVTGLPLSYTHTVVGGDTLASIATDIANHLNGIVQGPSNFVGAAEQTQPDSTAVVALAFPGNGTLGWAITVTAGVTGAATETVAVNNSGSQLSNTTLLGSSVMSGRAMGVATSNVLLGDGVGASGWTTASFNTIAGSKSGGNITSGGDNSWLGALIASTSCTTCNETTIGGFFSYQHGTTGSNISIWGSRSGSALTTGSSYTILGHAVGNVPTTGSGVILVGSGARTVETPAAATTNFINIENVWEVSGTGTASTAISMMSGAFQVGSVTASTLANGELGLVKTTLANSAPGAGFLKMAVAAGTSAGTCKLVAYAGTSVTPVTVVDNVGTGC